MQGDVSLVTQMRAGTHYMCAALRFALEAQVMRPRDGAFAPMDDADIIKDMHPHGRFALPPPLPGRHVYFSHYYHPQFRSLPPMPRLSLIGFPLACALAFRTPLGAVGVWIGLSVGTAVYATLLVLRFRLLANKLKKR